MDVERLTNQVRRNCDISDARHAGLYSICGLALRLRDLYKWTRRLLPWQEDEAGLVLEWIGNKEDQWESMAEEDFGPLSIGSHTFDPFDTEAVNAALAPHGLFYGAGYAYSLKPTFFLAVVIDRECVHGKVVWQLGRELARDLLTLPAFSQDDQVVLRTEAARMFVWDQMIYVRSAGRPALAFALNECCALSDINPDSLRPHLDTIMAVQRHAYIRHELGEIAEEIFDRDIWRQMLSDFPHTPVELLIRTLKDALADTGPDGPLRYFIEQRSRAGLGFYMAFGSGLTPLLFGPLKTAFDAFMHYPDWDAMTQAVDDAHRSAATYTREIIDLYAAASQGKGLPWAQAAIEKTLQTRGILR
ncbi:MAG: hypothetical protein VR64_04355 [Desulfatitalea sp. BRH_c12]|nr:MAG: hypothetical protein VR64_04355 [Desulfatitalea sp. BRH_c12]